MKRIKRIKRVSEAFSTTPREKSIICPPIKHIEFITEKNSMLELIDYYVGYDECNNELFRWIAAACNVEYIEPLFVTKDGITIFEGDIYYIVCTLNNYKIQKETPATKNWKSKHWGYLYFSTEESAVKWVEANVVPEI